MIPRTLKTIDGKRIYDKKHYCYFCGAADTKMARHIQTKHKNEARVKDVLRCGDGKQRKKMLDLLRTQGNFYHNVAVLRTGGTLVVARRPSEKESVNISDYVPCEFCLAFVTKAELWRHVKTCSHSKNVRSSVKKSELLLHPNKCSDNSDQELKVLVLDDMVYDDINVVVRQDEVILAYASFQLSTSGMRKVNSIRQRLRLLARLIIKLREKTGKEKYQLKNFITPEFFDEVVATTKELGGFKMITAEGEPVASFSTPSVPLKIGYTIEKCASLLRGIGIKQKDNLLEENAIKFAKLYKLEWSSKISSISVKTLGDNKFNKVQLLPVTDDLMKIRKFMKDQIKVRTLCLLENQSLHNWRSLAEVLGARLTIFNRRRGNEVYQLLLSRFKTRDKWKSAEMEDIKSTLTTLEKQLMNRYYFSR